MKINVKNLDTAMANNLFDIAVLAERSKVSRNSISRIKNGRTTEVRPSTVGKLAKALGCKVEDLLQEEK